MLKRLPFLLLTTLLLSCGDGGTDRNNAAGGKRYGGIFNVNETEPPRGFFPLEISQASVHRVAAQIYQGLVKLDPVDLSVRPCLAEGWTTDATATEWTFTLRTGVRFHDDPAMPNGEGREVTAADVVHCFTAICTGGEHNDMFWLFQGRVLGADGHYDITTNGIPLPEGVKGLTAVDERTVRIQLTTPMPGFLQILAHQGCWIWPRELKDAYSKDLMRHAIGTGPFRVREHLPGQALVLERNPHYWDLDADGNALPFLDGIRVTYVGSKERELDEFLQQRITCMFEPPVEKLAVLADSVDRDGVQRFIVQRKAALSTQFYGFHLRHAPFRDARVREAFDLAIDRRAIADSVLRGLAAPAEHGLVPPGMKGYPYAAVGGRPYDPVRARALLAEAGYPGGVGFPAVPLQLNTDGFGYVDVADAVQAMLGRNLGVGVAISSLPSEQHYAMVDGGTAVFWRQGWVADYPDPENFLALLYGRNAIADTLLPSPMNTSRFADPVFDSLYDMGQRTVDAQARLELLAQAERRAMDLHVIAPLYHEQGLRLLQPWVRDFPMNAMEYRDLSAVWFEKR